MYIGSSRPNKLYRFEYRRVIIVIPSCRVIANRPCRYHYCPLFFQNLLFQKRFTFRLSLIWTMVYIRKTIWSYEKVCRTEWDDSRHCWTNNAIPPVWDDDTVGCVLISFLIPFMLPDFKLSYHTSQLPISRLLYLIIFPMQRHALSDCSKKPVSVFLPHWVKASQRDHMKSVSSVIWVGSYQWGQISYTCASNHQFR